MSITFEKSKTIDKALLRQSIINCIDAISGICRAKHGPEMTEEECIADWTLSCLGEVDNNGFFVTAHDFKSKAPLVVMTQEVMGEVLYGGSGMPLIFKGSKAHVIRPTFWNAYIDYVRDLGLGVTVMSQVIDQNTGYWDGILSMRTRGKLNFESEVGYEETNFGRPYGYWNIKL